jgi:hypothetical protein
LDTHQGALLLAMAKQAIVSLYSNALAYQHFGYGH